MPKYSKIWDIHSCKLNRDDLSSLISIITAGFSRADIDNNLTISAQHGETEISSNNLEDILESQELPDIVKNFRINIYGANSVRLAFEKTYNQMYLRSDDKTWFLGRQQQIKDFLKKKRPFFWMLIEIFPFLSGILFVSAFLSAGYFYRLNEMIYAIISIIFLVILFFTTRRHFNGMFLPHAKILIREKDPFWNKENILIIINLIMLIVVIFGVLQSYFKFLS